MVFGVGIGEVVTIGAIAWGVSSAWNSVIDTVSSVLHPRGIDYLRNKGPEVTAVALSNALVKRAGGATGLLADIIDMTSAAVLIKIVQ